ncbi:S41 family peptidase [Oscillospiraceae bacterium OttesenSCG-928-G22]|nr:S41 family peptidase [Oscillospiraceae bacterium OttesenSCG-928-G22]
MKKRFNIPTVIGLMLLVSVVTFALTYLSVQANFNTYLTSQAQNDAALSKVSSVLGRIQTHYVGEWEFDELIDGALRGMVAATGDRWSHYLNAEEYAAYKLSSANEAVGIGVSVHTDAETGVITITRVHPNSPADEAGLERFDIIAAVDGVTVTDVTPDEAYGLIRGAEGTTVTLKILRYETGAEETIQFVRRNYTMNAVTSEIVGDGIGYVKIENFDAHVNINFRDAVNGLMKAGVKGIVFDVRNNPGGSKNVMVAMLDMLCPEGILFISRDNTGAEEVDRSDANEIDLPMVVITNESSISAAEFFAAALKEFGKAKIVGTPTNGKGYSQVSVPLDDGSGLILSTNEYFTPKGNSLIGVGLTPDHTVTLSEEKQRRFALLSHEEDDQFAEALSVMDDMIAALAAAEADTAE